MHQSESSPPASKDQQEGLLVGTDSTGIEIIGQPLMTLEEFILAN
jgi:NAD(P)H dehydrogenase (quinone)